MEWHAHNLLGKDILEKGKATIYGRGETRMNYVSAMDMGKFAVIGLTDPKACDRVINVGGPENFSKNQIAAMYQRLSGKTAQISHMAPFMLQVMGLLMRPFRPELARMIQLSYLMDTYDGSFDPCETLEEFPVELIRLGEFIKDRVAELQA